MHTLRIYSANVLGPCLWLDAHRGIVNEEKETEEVGMGIVGRVAGTPS